MADRQPGPSRRDRVLFYGVILVGVGLIALSLVVAHPVAQAAPDLYAAGVLSVLAAVLLSRHGRSDLLVLAAAGPLLVGAAGVCYDGLTTLGVFPPVAGVVLVADVAIIVGLGLFVYERTIRQPSGA